MSCGIYIIEHVVVSAKYIGLTSRPFKCRWNDYRERFPRKDGWIYRVLEECETSQLRIRERFYIAEAKLNGIPLLNKNNGGGGPATRVVSEATRQKLSNALKGKKQGPSARAGMPSGRKGEKHKPHKPRSDKGKKRDSHKPYKPRLKVVKP